ncbi:hypothetical protein TNCV_4533301 [Trichonephila clavipes]|nr:hypothetical protein TNCV_4533301 [Trichonephila clavipes]
MSKSYASKSSQVLSNDDIPTKKNTSPVVKSPACKTLKSEKVATKSSFSETPVKSESRKFASKCDIPLNTSIEKTPSESKTLKNSDTSSSSKSDSPITKTPIRNVSAKSKTSVDTASSPSISNERSAKSYSQQEKRRRSLNNAYKYDSEESEDEKEERSSKNKKRRIVIEPDDDSDEYMPEKDDESESSSASNEDSFESPARERKKTEGKSTPSFEIFTNPKASPKNKLNISASTTTPKSGARSSFSKICTPLKLQLPSNEEVDDSNESKKDVKEFLHEKWTWLKNGAMVGESKNCVENDGFERSTIRVPPDFYKTLTPAMQQWWRLKEKNFDTVLFFKVGKFYELYHMDAVIGVKELGLVYMKGDFAHAGFPEIAFGRYSECLIGKGYKVARVEQTETPQMMEERCKNSNCAKSKRVVEREICQITSKGTRTYTYQDENVTSSNNFLLVICEKVENSKSTSEYGICFIDTSIGKFTLGQFIDDRHGSRLLTLIALYPPVEVIYEKSSVTKETVQLLNHHLSGAQITRSGSDFWLPYKIMQHLQQTGIFTLEDELIEYPETFMKFLDPDDINKETPLKQYELAIKAFAGCISYLNRCGIDDSILSMKLFDEYIPVDEIKSEICKSSKDFKKHMVRPLSISILDLFSIDVILGNLNTTKIMQRLR